MRRVVGIDLGTTNSAVAIIDENGKPVIVKNAEGKRITPSVICFRDANTIIVGDEAKELQGLGIYPTAAFFKRFMGEKSFFLEFYGTRYSAKDLSSILLKKLKKDSEEELGEEITDAVITVPADFSEMQRTATIEAGKAAGLNILQIINEPTAAALAYGFNGRQKVGERILIYDLGGGTFDITLGEITPDGVKTITSRGNQQIGGKDWDARIISFLSTRFEEQYGLDLTIDRESAADLHVLAERAKRQLTELTKTKISITHAGERGSYELTREMFNEITKDLMYLTTSLTEKVLEDKGVRKDQIDGILLVGGSTRMPMVHKFIEDEFGVPPLRGVNVDEVVALGAAIVATETMATRDNSNRDSREYYISGRSKVVDVTNHSLGMIMINKNKDAYINSIILPKDRVIPCEEIEFAKQETSAHAKDNISEIYLTQGEGNSPANVNYLERHVIHNIPHTSGETILEVKYSYDVSGTVHVSAKVKGMSESLKITKEKLPNDVPARFLKPPEIKSIRKINRYNIFIAIDVSTSMRGEPLEDTKRDVYKFIKMFDLDYTYFGIMVFSDNCLVKIGLTNKKMEIKDAVDSIFVAETGVWNKAEPFTELSEILLNRGSKIKLDKSDSSETRNIIVVLTDGRWCDQKEAIKCAQKCIDRGIDIVAIGFGGADKEFIKKIASHHNLSGYVKSSKELTTILPSIAQSLK